MVIAMLANSIALSKKLGAKIYKMTKLESKEAFGFMLAKSIAVFDL
jgi:hypothetical protein